MQTCSASFLFCINHKERNIILRLFWSYKTLLQITAGFIFKRYIHIFESNRQKNAPNNQDNHRQGSKKKLRHLIYRLFYDNWLHHSSTLLLPCIPCAVLTAQLKHTCCPLCVLYWVRLYWHITLFINKHCRLRIIIPHQMKRFNYLCLFHTSSSFTLSFSAFILPQKNDFCQKSKNIPQLKLRDIFYSLYSGSPIISILFFRERTFSQYVK